MPRDDRWGGPPPEGRVPPYNKEAEQACLGAILLNNDAFDIVDGIIQKDSFYIEAYRRIYHAMSQLRSEKTPIDHVTLGERLVANGDLDKIGGAMALMDLADAVATVANVGHYANIVREKYGIRLVIYKSQELMSRAFNGADPADILELVEKVGIASQSVARSTMPTSIFTLGHTVMETYAKVEAGFSGIALPWETVNRMTMGMWPGTITFFVARPGVGKTMVAIIAARYAWLNNERVLIISPEMSKEEIAERFFVIHAGVNYDNVVRGTLSAFEKPKLVKTVDEALKLSGMWIMDSDDDLSPRGIEAAIRACNPSLIAVDALYDIHVKGDRRERLLTALDWLRKTTRHFGIPGVAFAQLNRDAELAEKKGGGIRLGTIALADEIAQDTHAIHALEQTKDMRADSWMRIRTLKIRRGRIFQDATEVNWNFETMNFSERDGQKQEKYEDDEIPF